MSLSDQQRIAAQQRAPAALRLWHALTPLQSVASFMSTGAHPDDETTAMLARLGRGDGVHISYACSTRGEGGQNALGTEAAADLGVLRTREMEESARVLDIDLYWLSEGPDDSIFDFGFSKSGEDTLARWGRDRVLERMVRIIRSERPDMVCPTFLDVPGQHGHHRAMTQAAAEAVVLAGDPAAFPDQAAEGLAPWQVKKFYLPAWAGTGNSYDDAEPPPPETVRVDASAREPVTGATFAQMGQWSRALHKTQGMGVWVDAGEKSEWPLHLAWVPDGEPRAENSIMDGVPRTLGDLAAMAEAEPVAALLKTAQTSIEAALSAWPKPEPVAKAAAEALGAVRTALAGCPEAARQEIAHRLARKERQLERVLFEASGMSARLSAEPAMAAPGGSVAVTVALSTEDSLLSQPPAFALAVPEGWRLESQGDGRYRLDIPDDAAASDPYPDRFDPAGANGALTGMLSFALFGQKIEVPLELEQPLTIRPAQSAGIEPDALLINLAARRAPLSVRLQDEGGRADLLPPEGWTVTPMEDRTISISPPELLEPGLYRLPAMIGGKPALSVRQSDHAHIGSTVRTVPAVLRLRALSVDLPEAAIGYIGGGNDRVDHWLRAMGFTVTSLGPDALENSDFAAFDSLLVGIFAFGSRPDLPAQLPKLHDWVRAGGNLVTLYHRPWDNWQPDTTALAHLEIGSPSLRWRVTDERAEVTHLDPAHPLLTSPNPIGPKDWADWNKERGLYFARAWDEAYTPLLSMADPDEAPHTGSLLSGRFGKGRHTHTSLILHHQMEHLVPGAFRLMANLLAPPNGP